MGIKTKIYSPSKGKLYAPLPPEVIQLGVEELPRPMEFTTNTYVYSGTQPPANIPLAKKRAVLPRGTPGWYRVGIRGIEDWYKEVGGFPNNVYLTHIQMDGEWIKIEDTPLTPGVWSSRYTWRSGIPMDIVRRYNMYSPQPVKIYFTTIREVLRARVYHDGEIYPVMKYNDRFVWDIPPNVSLSEGILIDSALEPMAECHYNPATLNIEVDLLYRSFQDNMIAKSLGFAHRNMSVRNYSMVEHGQTYPFLFEIRAWWVSTPKREFWQDDNPSHRMKLIDALRVTVENISQLYLPSSSDNGIYSGLSFAEHIGKVSYSTEPFTVSLNGVPIQIDAIAQRGGNKNFFIKDFKYPVTEKEMVKYSREILRDNKKNGITNTNLRISNPKIAWDYLLYIGLGIKIVPGDRKIPAQYVETMGEEINEKRGIADVSGEPFGYCLKYIRIVKKDYNRGMWVYDNQRIEEGIPLYRAGPRNIYRDKYGFVWNQQKEGV